MQHDDFIPTLLIVGFCLVVGAAALFSAKLALFSAGMILLISAWSLLRAGRP